MTRAMTDSEICDLFDGATAEITQLNERVASIEQRLSPFDDHAAAHTAPKPYPFEARNLGMSCMAGIQMSTAEYADLCAARERDAARAVEVSRYLSEIARLKGWNKELQLRVASNAEDPSNYAFIERLADDAQKKIAELEAEIARYVDHVNELAARNTDLLQEKYRLRKVIGAAKNVLNS